MIEYKPTLINGRSTSQTVYPRLTEVAVDICPTPTHSEFGSGSLNSSQGPYFFSVFDTASAIKSDGTPAIASPTKRYVAIFSSDHAVADGGLWVAWGDTPTGNFTLTGNDPQIDADDLPGTGTQLEAVLAILWNPVIEKFVLFPHKYKNAEPTIQPTIRITTTDFVTFDPEVISGDSEVIYNDRAQHFGYGVPYVVNCQLKICTMYNGFPSRMYTRWTPADDAWKYWAIDQGVFMFANPHPFMSLDSDWLFMGPRAFFEWKGALWCLFGMRMHDDTANRDDSIWIAPMDHDGWTFSGEPREVIPQRTSGEFGDATTHAPTVLVHGSEIYIYCSGIKSTDSTQAVIVYKVAND